MKRKLSAILLAVFMLLPCLTVTTFADNTGPKDVRSIPGIDYDRITQKADGGKKSYPVELNLGELTFNGQLKGDVGLDINELNEIINKTLKEKNLSPSRVALISQLGKQVTRDAALQWGSQVIEGVLSFIPVDDLPIASDIPGGFGIDDYFRYVVYGETKSMGDVIKDEYVGDIDGKIQKKIENVLEKAIAKSGKLTKATGGKVPLFGAVVNTIKTAVKWKEGNPRLDKYLEDLSKAQADVVDFYAACSRKANDLAESKGTNTWRIEFDGYQTYRFNMWGIQGLTMTAELTGMLTESIGTKDDGSGTYRGILTLNLEAIEMMETFDMKFKDNTNIPVRENEWGFYESGMGYGFTETINQPTSLSRRISGEVYVTVNRSSGEVTAPLDGNLFENDITAFTFDHIVSHELPPLTPGILLRYSITANSVEEATINKYTEVWGRYDEKGNFVPTQEATTVTQSGMVDKGTVWQPLESTPTVIIDFGYTRN